jgi:hypothetical protein
MHVQVMVEVIPLRVGPEGLGYRQLQSALPSGLHPDDAAGQLVDTPHDILLHSTSWRYDALGRVVLTYAACPDPRPDLPAAQLEDPEPATAATERRPSPPEVRVGQVAMHAVRHLAWLAVNDPIAVAFIAERPDLALALASHSPELAGRL